MTERRLTDEQQDLAAQHFPFAKWLAGQWLRRYPNLRLEDEIQSATHLGLVYSARKFQPERGTRFISLARKTMDREVKRALRIIMQRQERDYQWRASLPTPVLASLPPEPAARIPHEIDGIPIWFKILTPKQRQVLGLRYGLKMRPRDIETTLGYSKQRVASILKRGTAKMIAARSQNTSS